MQKSFNLELTYYIYKEREREGESQFYPLVGAFKHALFSHFIYPVVNIQKAIENGNFLNG